MKMHKNTYNKENKSFNFNSLKNNSNNPNKLFKNYKKNIKVLLLVCKAKLVSLKPKLINIIKAT
jgi:hypothetical protein